MTTGRRDEGLERLLDLDGFLAEIGGGYWVKIVAQGVFGIDNAHPVRVASGPAGRRSMVQDHVHRGDVVRQYAYQNAETLLDDFWREVEAILKREGVV